MTDSIMPTYARAPLRFQRGEGVWLIDESGERYLDFGAGVAVSAFGHAHPALVDVLKRQAEKLWHVSNLYQIENQEKLADLLCANSFADRVFFTNSGAEAMECAFKTARKYMSATGQPERWRMLTFEGCFHGRTLATIAAAGQEKLIDGFGPMPDGFDHAPFGDHEALERMVTPETAAIVIEPIQGEGGIRPVPEQCLKGLRDLCDREGILLILDEIQTGMGRTGKLFAHEWAGIEPDIMAVAKGIGGGFPLGACLATEKAAVGMTAGAHGSTYGGNPLATSVGAKVLELMLEPGFFAGVSRAAGALRQRLEGLAAEYPDVIAEVRGGGLMIGLKCAAPCAELIQAARDAKLLLVPAGDNVARALPPLIVTEAEIEEGVRRLTAACEQVRAAK
ncbi:MAG: aspartate aminotransferase family protein [Neomegalonema sp.]|nr:aspartate aminotransferase family protein [Neomegalonema sp.]